MMNYRVVLKDGKEFKVKADNVRLLSNCTEALDEENENRPVCTVHCYSFVQWETDENDDERMVTVGAVAFTDVGYITSEKA